MSLKLIDTNAYLSRWPFRRLPLDETRVLVGKLRQHNVVEAWVGNFDGLLHKDIASVNARLAEECEEHGKKILLPFGSINPTLPDWEEDVRRCHEEFKMKGIRLHPNYHGYKLNDPSFEKLLRMATERKLLVQLAVIMEDRRTQHPLISVEPVDVSPLAKIINAVPNLRLQLLNAMQHVKGPLLLSTLAAGDVAVEIATLEGAGGIGNLLTIVGVDRVLFGSYSPFFNFESALLKMKESELTKQQGESISAKNAKRLIGR